MKKLFTLLALIATIAIFAQAPLGFNYQATVRNNTGTLIVNQSVYFKFNILLNSQTSVPIFTETHYVATDGLGQVNLVVGQGTATVGTFSSINWANGSYYLGIEINTGSGYVAMGTTQLLSVPYALYANSAGNSNSNLPNGTNVGDTLNWIWNGSAWVPTSSIATSQLPVVSTIIATNNLTPSPTTGGTITSDGGYSITSKGVCWSTSPNPSINNNSTNDGTGALNFTSIISNLLPTTTYYYRAYATNSIGTGYGNTYTFTTAVPQITTTIISAITSSTANSGGYISSSGGALITAVGVCWSTSPNPTILLSTKTNNGTGLTTFISNITGLALGTTYYVRAYATNSLGTAYGQEEIFITDNATTLPNVTIGTQIWTSNNLDVTTYVDGTEIPQVTDPTVWTNLTTGAWCYYNNQTQNGTTYGKLYNWYAVSGIHDTDPSTPNKTLAPTGWHIPSDTEWTILTTFLGGESIAGGKMKATGCTLWRCPNEAATNSSGFTGIAGGYRSPDNGTFFNIGTSGSWWSSSRNNLTVDPTDAWVFGLYYSVGSAGLGHSTGERDGFSVRCLKD